MKHTNTRRILGLLLALALLLAAVPQARAEQGEDTKPVIEVKTVDELVAAVGPNVTVALAAGTYDLATASTYGQDTGNPCCRWGAASEQGYELYITGTDGMTLRGAGMDETILLAEDRYASVLTFSNCQNVTVSSLTAGHSPAPGYCSGGVLHLMGCTGFAAESCGLFGCGTVGVWVANCTNVTVTGSRIYECSENAVYADNCRNVQVLDCEIDHNGWRTEGDAHCLFQAYSGDGFTVSDCRVHDNSAALLLQCSFTRDTRFITNLVAYNTLQSAFSLFEYPATVDGCTFYSNNLAGWYAQDYEHPSLAVRDKDGRELSEAELAAMQIRPIALDEVPTVPLQEPTEVPVGVKIIVTSVDEFLAAIGPDRTIVLNGENFCLANAATYGSTGGRYYRWEECYDGPQLVISGVSNLTICGADPENVTQLTAVPRYANVLGFQSCENVAVSGLTMGHTEGPSECAGAVLSFDGCNGITVSDCFLYGCGTLGVEAWYGTGLELRECEIYDCSLGGVVLGSINGVTMQDCSIHDVPSPALTLYDCNNVLWNGAPVFGNHYDVTAAGTLEPVTLG